jgi:hypothetical protein
VATAESPCQQRLVGAGAHAVELGGVEERGAEIQGLVDGRRSVIWCHGSMRAVAERLRLEPLRVTALRSAGRTVPDDVAVGEFDDARIAATLQPPLTTVRQPMDRIGYELADLVQRLSTGGSPLSMVMPVELAVREST